MDLPPELLDEVINHISPTDKRSLLNCSLVAKSWVYPSQKRIFKAVDIWRNPHLKSWLGAISPTNVRVLQHVRSIRCQIAKPLNLSHPPVDLLCDYSPSFRQLERLTLHSGLLPSLNQIGTYSAFQHTLSYLCLWHCSATSSRIVILVNYFPNLAHLELGDLSHMVDGQPAPPFSRLLRKLTIAEFCTKDSLDLLDQLMGLHPQCDEVSIDMFWDSCPSLAQHVIDGVEASVKRLNLESRLEDLGVPLTLSNCRELRELEICALCPRTMELDLISSITSANIRRISFTPLLSLEGQSDPDHTDWAKLDNSLCQLVGRLERGARLEVEFQALNTQAWSGVLDFKKYLPKFYEKGGVDGGRGK